MVLKNMINTLMTYFVDTGKNHKKVKDLMMNFLNEGKPIKFITTDQVISETFTYLRYNTTHDVALNFLEEILASEATNHLEILFTSMYELRSAKKLLNKYEDQKISFVDAVSFVQMDKKGLEIA